MPATDTWKKLSTEAVLKGYASPVATFFVGLGGNSFAVGANDIVVGETTGTGYERVPVQWTDFVANMTNSNVLLWTAGGAWGTVTDVFVSDAFQGGAVLLHDGVPSKNLSSGDTISIDIGNLILT